MEEIWKPVNVSGYENLYIVSNYGKIKSLDRISKNGTGTFIKKGKLLKNHINNMGYEYIYLINNTNKKKMYVHRLVALTFLPNPENKKEVNHLDCNPLNNKVNNLEWCTRQENVDYMVKLGRSKKEGIWLAKITYKNLLKSKRVVQIDHKNKKVCVYQSIQCVKEKGYRPGDVCRCCKGNRKKHKGYEWKYYEDFKRIYC